MASVAGIARTALDRGLRWSLLQLLWSRRNRRKLLVLAYHGVTDPRSFAAHMAYLRDRFCVLSEEQVLEVVRDGRRPPRTPVFVTFDDGDPSVVDVALPILRTYGMPAAAYVVAAHVDTDQPLWWDEAAWLVERGAEAAGIRRGTPAVAAVKALKGLPDPDRRAVLEELRASAPEPAPRRRQLRARDLQRLRRAGVAVGNHTLTHPCLSRCSDQRIRQELREAQSFLTAAAGSAPNTLAYPGGDQDGRVREEAASCGISAAFLFDHRLSAAPPPDPLRISRVRVDSTTSMDRFRIIVSGLHPALHRALGRR